MKNDKAVSPIIGVILMVAITIILAAVIASLVFGMAGNLKPSNIVSVSLSRINSLEVMATYHGHGGFQKLQYINWSVNGGKYIIQGDYNKVLKVGNTTIIPANSTSRVIGIAHFIDGKEELVITTVI